MHFSFTCRVVCKGNMQLEFTSHLETNVSCLQANTEAFQSTAYLFHFWFVVAGRVSLQDAWIKANVSRNVGVSIQWMRAETLAAHEWWRSIPPSKFQCNAQPRKPMVYCFIINRIVSVYFSAILSNRNKKSIHVKTIACRRCVDIQASPSNYGAQVKLVPTKSPSIIFFISNGLERTMWTMTYDTMILSICQWYTYQIS